MNDKNDLLQDILAQLNEERETLSRAAQATYEAATHEESAAEDKYDTRGLEASYLAGAQARRVMELDEALSAYERLELRTFDANTRIGLSAVITVEDQHEQRHYFFGPHAGGLKLIWQNTPLVVITPQSPIGQKLLGSLEGDIIEVQRPNGVLEIEIIRVL